MPAEAMVELAAEVVGAVIEVAAEGAATNNKGCMKAILVIIGIAAVIGGAYALYYYFG
jgi:hypothetical protein